MKHQFLTLRSCYQGIFLNRIESIFSIPLRDPVVPSEYRLVRWIKRQGGDNIASVGIFEDKSGRRVILKHLWHRWKNLTYRQMLNEVSLLQLFAGWSYEAASGRTVLFPTLREVVESPGALIIVKEFEEGETLDAEPEEIQVAVTVDCLEALQSLQFDKQSPIGKRTAWQIGLSFPLYWLRACLKDLGRVRQMVNALIAFYRHWSGTIERRMVITHRDLHLNNILTNGQRVFMLDIEGMVLCAKETELAILARFNHQHWGRPLIHQILGTYLDTRSERRSFSALSIYYAIQMMVTDQISGADYRQSISYIMQYEKLLESLMF